MSAADLALPGQRRAARGKRAAATCHRRPAVGQGGFTLLEVLVAVAILGIAVVSFIELSSKSLRLIKSSGEYQQAVELADRIATESDPVDEGVDSGEEGPYRWARTVALVPLPDEYKPAVSVPGQEPPKLFSVTVDVAWGYGQALQVATLRTPTTPPPVSGKPAAGNVQPQDGSGVQQGAQQPGIGNRTGTGNQQTGTTPSTSQSPFQSGGGPGGGGSNIFGRGRGMR